MVLEVQDADGEISESCHDTRSRLRADAAAIFVECAVTDIMQTVFDTPVPPVEHQESFRARLLGTQSGDAEGNLPAKWMTVQIGRDAFAAEGLLLVREVAVIDQFGADPDSARLNPTVPFVEKTERKVHAFQKTNGGRERPAEFGGICASAGG